MFQKPTVYEDKYMLTLKFKSFPGMEIFSKSKILFFPNLDLHLLHDVVHGCVPGEPRPQEVGGLPGAHVINHFVP